jgi:CBS domain-containing protein
LKQIMTGAPAHKSPSHPPAATATVTDVMRPPLTTAGQYDHVAAAAYLMKHTGTTALMVVNAQTGQPAGIITQADVARAIAGGKDLNNIRVHAAMTARPAVNTATSIRDAAEIMTATHFRHLPVAGDAGLLGTIDITDVCQALNNAGERWLGPVARVRDWAAPPRRQAADLHFLRPHNAWLGAAHPGPNQISRTTRTSPLRALATGAPGGCTSPRTPSTPTCGTCSPSWAYRTG